MHAFQRKQETVHRDRSTDFDTGHLLLCLWKEKSEAKFDELKREVLIDEVIGRKIEE